MSPEQAQGKRVDSRSDIFSFAVVLYEMVTGTRAFAGDSALSTLSAILRDEARPIPEIAPDTPPQLEQVIHRCLRKHPDQRFQTMKEVQVALGALKHESDSGMLYRTRAGMEPWPKPKRSPASADDRRRSGGRSAGDRRGRRLVVDASDVQNASGRTAQRRPQPQNDVPPCQPVPGAASRAPLPCLPAPPADQALTNDNIIQMVDAKVAPAIILSQIRNSKTAFNLSAQEVIRLSKAHVPGNGDRGDAQPQSRASQACSPRLHVRLPRRRLRRRSAPLRPLPAPPSRPRLRPRPRPRPRPLPPLSPRLGPSWRSRLTDGMPFSITLAEDIPQNAEEGRPLRFTVAKEVRVGDLVVIAKGATVTGAIAQAARKGTFGIGGTKMTLRLLVVDAVDGHKYRVRAQSARSCRWQE